MRRSYVKIASFALTIVPLGVIGCSRNDRNMRNDQPSGTAAPSAGQLGRRPAIGGGPRAAADGGYEDPEREEFTTGMDTTITGSSGTESSTMGTGSTGTSTSGTTGTGTSGTTGTGTTGTTGTGTSGTTGTGTTGTTGTGSTGMTTGTGSTGTTGTGDTTGTGSSGTGSSGTGSGSRL